MANQTEIKFGYPNTLIKQYKYWTVLLREEQVTLGSLVLCAKSEVTKFSALSTEEFIEMGIVISDIERVLKRAFDYDKINYLMLMMIDLNVHFHVFPRYAVIRKACGFHMIDQGWPTAPKLADTKTLTTDESNKLRKRIISFW